MDALELAALSSLGAKLSPADTAVAWSQIRSCLSEHRPSRDLVVVYDLQLKKAKLSDDLRAIGPELTHGRPLRIVVIGELMEDVKEAFRRVAAAMTSETSASSDSVSKEPRRQRG